MEMLEDKLEVLLMSKSYDELSQEEKCYVSAHMTVSEYMNYHLLLSKTVEAFDQDAKDLFPDPAIPVRLKKGFEDRFHPSKVPFSAIFSSLIIYRSVAAAGLTAVIVFFFLVQKSDDRPVRKQSIPVVGISPIRAKTNKPEKTIWSIGAPSSVVKTKKLIKPRLIIIKQDTLHTSKSEELLGMDVNAPILCLDIDLNELVPGLKD